MAHIRVRLACLLTLLAATLANKDQTRWSRQISSYTSDISDWVPLSGPVEREPITPPPIKRQAVAEPRILTETFPGISSPTGFSQETIPSRAFYNSPANRQLYLQSMPAVPSAPQNYLTDQGFSQGIRFGLSQPNFPLSQGFVAPQFAFDTAPQVKPRPQAIPSSPVKFESFQKPSLPITHQKPYVNQQPQTKPEAPKFVDGYRAENASNDFLYSQKIKPQSLQKMKFDNFNKSPKIQTIPQNSPKVEREEVQLLYVPVESLNRGQFNFRSPLTTPQLVNTDLYSQGLPRPNPLKHPFNDFQRPVAKPLETFSEQDYFTNFNSQLKDLDQVPKFSSITTPFPTAPTTPKPKKLKPHQPPLAIFLTQEASRNNQMKVGDVLSSLKSSNTIAVLDSVNPLNAPKVFIGPSTLTPPENYIKFELPYLSNIENSDKKLKQLPFFVAPLSYNTPQGFAKIPFPSPHVGSVVINSQIKETQANQPTVTNSRPNVYSTAPQTFRQEQRPVTQRPTVSFYSTVPPRTNSQPKYPSNYYTIEPQLVSSIRPQKELETVAVPPKHGNYFANNAPPQYNNQHVNFQQNDFQAPKSSPHNIPKQQESRTTTATPRTTTTVTTTTTKAPSTYPSKLLETHNPYSINQAFHFSTPIDYHNFFDDVKGPIETPGSSDFKPSRLLEQPATSSDAPSNIDKAVTEKQRQQLQSSPNYQQNYTPEIHYESEVQNTRYSVFNENDYTTKPDISSELRQPVNSINDNNNIPINSVNPTEYTGSLETQPSFPRENFTEIVNQFPTQPEAESPQNYEFTQFVTNYNTEESATSSTTSTTTTTTRRTPIRNRSRTRYTTQRTESNESTTRAIVTRRPLRERRPLPSRPKYEPNRIATEKTTKKPVDFNESTTKSSRTRTRGRVQYRPTDNDEIYDKRIKTHSTKDKDLAYQRDVLHQNYPVTLMERTSTVDIEAITEPALNISPKNIESITETFDTANAYTNEKASISQDIVEDPEVKGDIYIPRYTSKTPVQTETTYAPRIPSTRNEDYLYQSRSSVAPVDAISYDDTAPDRDETYPKETTPIQNVDTSETVPYATESLSSIVEQDIPIYSINDELSPAKQEEANTPFDIEMTKDQEIDQEVEEEEEENVVQTTPSYNRVRVRPGVIRQYHQASTDSSRNKVKRKPGLAVTYRPAYDRRRTTMRIDEIEADLKTKQVHNRPEVEDYKHPVYKPEATTEPSVTQSTQETATKRGNFRRRRPNNTHTSTSTEGSVSRRTYEVKNRFRGRRPTEKPTDRPEVQTETTTSTTRNPLYTRYSHRPRLSERYNKKPESEEIEDQDSNFSISRPKYVEPETGVWSPKISVDSFKPYNPNDIVEDKKTAPIEHKPDQQSELDIITARNEYEDILLTVTPASNNRNDKKIPEIPPTLEALVEQSKVTKSDSTDSMSTFESMLEEVMKSLEEQDEDEYSSNVMKHKGGEIGEIPPEQIISSEDTFTLKSTTPIQETTTLDTTAEDSALLNEEDNDRRSRRRGFWKRVKVRPVTTESIEFAESQYYTSTVNRLGLPVKSSKTTHDKTEKSIKKIAVTTYKPTFKFIKDFFGVDDELLTNIHELPNVDIPKLDKKTSQENKTVNLEERATTIYENDIQTEKTTASPGDLDLGTGSPDPTIDEQYYTTQTYTDLTTTKTNKIDRSDGFSFMDYLFGVTSKETGTHIDSGKINETLLTETEIPTESKSKIDTTENSYIPEEITTQINNNTDTEEFKRVESTEKSKDEEKSEETTEISVVKVETSSVSSFMNPANVVSTSMSTQVSHETEICFRGKCIKTSRNIL